MSRILLYDVETAANELRGFGHFDVRPIQITRPYELLSIAWKYYGERGVNSLARKDYKSINGDFKLARTLYDVLSDDDVSLIVGHNISGFDNPTANTRFRVHSIHAVPNTPVFDTLTVARKYFRFPGNSLDELASFLGIGRKVETGGKNLWIRCMDSDKSALRKMRKYNEHDVRLLEKVYEKLAPYARNLVNLRLLNGEARTACPVPTCGSKRTQRRGYNVAAKTWSRRYQCQDCGHWFSLKDKDIKKPRLKVVA